MFSQAQIVEVLSQVTIGDLEIRLRYDEDRPYIQVYCENGIDTATGKPTSWSGRKWMLSPHMCKQEIVRTAFKAYICAIMHEAEETFRYRGVPIFSPHFDIDTLVDNFKEDARVNGMTGL